MSIAPEIEYQLDEAPLREGDTKAWKPGPRKDQMKAYAYRGQLRSSRKATKGQIKRPTMILAKNRAAAMASAAEATAEHPNGKPVHELGRAKGFVVKWRDTRGGVQTWRGFDVSEQRVRQRMAEKSGYAGIESVQHVRLCETATPKAQAPYRREGAEDRWERICATDTVPVKEYLGSSAKSEHSEQYDNRVLNRIMYLAPHSMAAGSLALPAKCASMCKYSTAGCRATCLNESGQGASDAGQAKRINKTRLFLLDPEGFVEGIRREVRERRVKQLKDGHVNDYLAIRLNGTSDIRWERLKGASGLTVFHACGEDGNQLCDKSSGVQFYDYTKWPPLHRASPKGVDYRLTYSYDGTPRSYARAKDALALGWPVSVVFDTGAEAKRAIRDGRYALFPGVPVVDGDEHDLRFEERAAIAALKPKFPSAWRTRWCIATFGRFCNKPQAVQQALRQSYRDTARAYAQDCGKRGTPGCERAWLKADVAKVFFQRYDELGEKLALGRNFEQRHQRAAPTPWVVNTPRGITTLSNIVQRLVR